jgi:hypothetical protein
VRTSMRSGVLHQFDCCSCVSQLSSLLVYVFIIDIIKSKVLALGSPWMLNFVKIGQVLIIVRKNVSSTCRGPNQATSGEFYGGVPVTCPS